MRGISPIVSTILMVAIAIAAAVVVYYITMDVVTQQGAQLQEQATTRQEAVVIDVIDANTTAGTVDIYVRNIVDYNVDVTGAYILEGDTVVCANTTTTTVPAGQVSTITVSNCTMTAGTTYTAKVTTSGGAVAQKPFKV